MDLVNIPYRFFASLCHTVRNPGRFEDVKAFALFIGYPRSGHTLVGFLLDAHPNMLVASQTSALKHLKHGFGMKQIFHLLAQDSERVARTGREHRRYSYEVPNQWHGKFEKLRAIGESTGMTRLRQNPSLLKSLREKFAEVDLRLIHVIRNPYDNISTMKIKSGESLPDAIRRYFSMCDIVEAMKPQVDAGAVHDLYHESLIENPKETLKGLCVSLGLECAEDYLSDCASIIYKSSHKSRKEVDWDPPLIETVKQRMRRFSYLDRYSYDD
jgi:hypothetical protein